MSAIHTRIWHEEPEPDNPFATRAAYCRGYDVFGAMIGKTRWVEMLMLLFRDDLPDARSLDMFEALAVALANPGPRDASVHAAMCGGVGGSTAAATLIAALSAGAGRYKGARGVFAAMAAWHACGDAFPAWPAQLVDNRDTGIEVWPQPEHAAGFDPYGSSTATSVCQLLGNLARIAGTPRLVWLDSRRAEVESQIGLPLDFAGVAAAAFCDLGFTPEEGEILYLMLRLPGAAAHAIEQKHSGFKRFPFPEIELEDDPARSSA